MRVTEDVEVSGIDQDEHAETAYDYSGAGGGSRTAGTAPGGVAGTAAKAGPANKKVDA